MSKHNYSQYSNKNYNKPNNHAQKPKSEAVKPSENIEPVVSVPEVKMVSETVETVSLPETVEGFVANCAKLNVREKATINSDIVCVLDVMSEIEIDVNKSTSEWIYICTATGLEGYCMRQYIDAHL